MKLTLELTLEQEAALQRSLVSAHPDPDTRLTLEDFAAAACYAKINEHVSTWAARDELAFAAKIERHAAKFSAEDRAAVEAIVAKHEAAAVAVEAIETKP